LVCFFWNKQKDTQNGEKVVTPASLTIIANDINKKISEIFDPNELSKIARECNFTQRSTALLQGEDFVDLMTAASLDPQAVPLEILCTILQKLNPEAVLTPQSLMERINRPESAAFLKAIFQKSLEKGLNKIVELIPAELLKSFKNVYIEDCSECALNEVLQENFKGSGGGASKASVKLDFIYEMKQRRVVQVELTDRRSPDQKLAQRNLRIIQQGDLSIQDLGFFDVDVLKAINGIGAFFLSRLHSSVNIYINNDDEEPIDIAKYLNTHYPNDSVIDLWVFVTKEKFPCRLVAYRAPKELAEKRRRESNKEAVKKGRKQKQSSINRLDFSFFLTNVPEEVWKAEVVGTVYTLRWQIELIFKNWKSSLKIHYLKGMNPDRIRCLLYGKLITIAVINLIYKFAAWYAQKLGREISLHKVVNWLKVDNRLAVIILGGFKHRFMKELIRDISKSMCKQKRKRKTTQDALDMGIPFGELYGNSNTYHDENQWVKVA
jgi:hypothetical protein